MEQYSVTGMSCAACQARVEKAVSGVPGVERCAVSLLTNSMGVEGTAPAEDIIKAVEKAGYGAALRSDSIRSAEDALRDTETPKLKRRLALSVGFLLLLLYFSMGHMMLGLPLPAFFGESFAATGLVQMVLALVILFINRQFFISGFRSLANGSPNMDTLVAMGSAVAFAWSAVVLAKGGVEFYFETAAMIVTLITVGKLLEAMSKGRTTNALRGLMELAPKTVTLIETGADGGETERTVPVEEVQVGDIFAVRPGENIPVDGVILYGSTAVNEAALTGESIPVDKKEGDRISAATLNQSGYIRAEATRVGEDTTLSQIIRMVSDAAATKAPIARIADRVSGVFVPAVLVIALIVILIWLVCGAEMGYALARGISVLVISCPCALGLATPVAIMVGNGVGAKNGILFKTAQSQEEAGRVSTVVLDKTGTITEGRPRVTDLLPAEGVTEDELLGKAFALERRSEHPLAVAVVDAAKAAGPEAMQAGEITDFAAAPGNGLTGVLNGRTLTGGNLEFVESAATVDSRYTEQAGRLAEEGKTCLFFAEEDKFLGVIAVADTIKEDSPEAVRQLRNMGIRAVMLTGDDERTARAIAAQAGVDEIIAGVKPDGKEREIRKLMGGGKVAMVGDGINDAPALTRADVGIAIGAGTDVAVDAADVVLMNSSLLDVPAAIRLGRATLRNIHENLFWAFIYNVALIPVAAGAYVHLTGWTMNPMLGAAAMSLSSFCVCMNALRLNLFDVHSPRRDKRIKQAAPKEERLPAEANTETEEQTMEKTMNIEGMMCMHCEATVKKALEAIDGVEAADVSHEENRAVVTLRADVADEVLKEAVEAKDYSVVSIE